RKSLTHALNMKWAARNVAARMDRSYDELNLITAHLGGGISIAVHSAGQMVDSVDANGEGPFSPERCGGLRVDDVVELAINSGQSFAQFHKRLTGNGGLMSHLGTTDAIEVERLAQAGEQPHRMVYEAMAYGIAKHICAMSAAVYGKVDGIVITGGLAKSDILIEWISKRVEHIASVTVLPGEFEMEALHEGAVRAINGREPVRIYPTGEFEESFIIITGQKE
ncbi:MAG: butyrate kinase, partial [bacterium]|nr:butyrate kinase [bacterium]